MVYTKRYMLYVKVLVYACVYDEYRESNEWISCYCHLHAFSSILTIWTIRESTAVCRWCAWRGSTKLIDPRDWYLGVRCSRIRQGQKHALMRALHHELFIVHVQVRQSVVILMWWW